MIRGQAEAFHLMPGEPLFRIEVRARWSYVALAEARWEATGGSNAKRLGNIVEAFCAPIKVGYRDKVRPIANDRRSHCHPLFRNDEHKHPVI
jgi:hypothetical protein